MTFSIITVAYNAEGTVRQTIESVLSQDYSPIEYLFVDGASTDGTMGIVRSYGHAFSWTVSEPDGGIYDAMNKGIRAAKGDVIGILNADNFFEDSGVVRRVARAFEVYNCDIVYGDLRIVGSDGRKVIRDWRAGRGSPLKMALGWQPPHPAVFVTRRVYAECGTFDPAYRISGDYELMLRLLYGNRRSARYLASYLVRMRAGGISGGGIASVKSRFREDRVAARRHGLGVATVLMKMGRKIPQFVLAALSWHRSPFHEGA